MKQQQSIKMPLEDVEKALRYLDLNYVRKKLPDGNATQLRLTPDQFMRVKVNVYNTNTVVVQPEGDPKTAFVRRFLRLRAARLRRKGEIVPD